MRQPGWDEPAETLGSPPADEPPAMAPRHTGVVDAGAYHEQPLPPAGWRPVAAGLRSRSWEPTRREVVTGLGFVAILAAAGLGMAVAWVTLAPRLSFTVVSPGQGVSTAPEGEQYFAADGWFTLLTLAAGVLAAVLVWRVRSVRGPTVLVALAVGGLAGALVTWRFGIVLAPASAEQALRQVGGTVHQALRLRALSALVAEPVAAVVTYLLCVGFASRTDLGRQDAPPEPDDLG